MQAITNASEGKYKIRTETGSTYLVDFAKRVITRKRGRAGKNIAKEDIARLGDDNVPVNLVYVVSCNVGEQAVFIVEPHIIELTNAIRKTTTKVLSITKN